MEINELAEAIGIKTEELTTLKAELKAMRKQMNNLKKAQKRKAKGRPARMTYDDALPILTEIAWRASQAFHINISEMVGESRESHLVSARAAFAKAATDKGVPIGFIAKYIRRDRSTLFVLVKDFDNRLKYYTEHRNAMLQVINQTEPTP